MADVDVTIELDLELQTDPIGATLDIGVPRAPSDAARQSLLNSVESTMVGARDNLVFQSVQAAHRQLTRYRSTTGNHVQSIKDSFSGVDATRSPAGITASWHWEHEAAGYYEFGVSPHTIDGNPILSFLWEDPPDWVTQEFDQARGSGGQFESGYRVFFASVDHPGIPEARFVRSSLDWLRREVRT